MYWLADIHTFAFAPVMGSPEGKKAAEGPITHWPGYLHKLVINFSANKRQTVQMASWTIN